MNITHTFDNCLVSPAGIKVACQDVYDLKLIDHMFNKLYHNEN